MGGERNVELDTISITTGNRVEDFARLKLSRACGYTPDGSAPILTRDASSYAQFEAEARRLKDEIDDALSAAANYFEKGTGNRTQKARSNFKALHAGQETAKPRIDTSLRVDDVMSRNIRTVNANDRLSIADELMRLGRHRHVVVIDDDGQLAGVISHRDVFHGALAWSLGHGAVAHEKSLESYPVKQVMETDVVTTTPKAPLSEAADLMREHQIGCLPVVDGVEIVGIITEGDFLALMTG